MQETNENQFNSIEEYAEYLVEKCNQQAKRLSEVQEKESAKEVDKDITKGLNFFSVFTDFLKDCEKKELCLRPSKQSKDGDSYIRVEATVFSEYIAEFLSEELTAEFQRFFKSLGFLKVDRQGNIFFPTTNGSEKFKAVFVKESVFQALIS